MSLSKVSVLVKTFLRDQHLSRTVGGLLQNLPEARLIVVDDGERSEAKERLYERLSAMGHQVVWLPFDSGFGRKSNAGAAACDRPYLLVASDDFDFWDPQARQGVERLVAVLDNAPQVAIASGRVNGYRYEGWLEDYGRRIVERYIDLNLPPLSAGGVAYHRCNLTVNYSLIRLDILGPCGVHWDDDVKIGGGEHGAFFVDVMRAGHSVAYVPGVNINEHRENLQADPRYHHFRGRARQPGRPCFKRRGIEEYVMFGGGVEKA